jgi:uncharacterized Zn finger protein
VRLIEPSASPAALAEGLTYARNGQTRVLEVKPGTIAAKVQGRMPAAYNVTIRFPLFNHTQWEQVTLAMVQQSRFAAAILAGQLPSNIEDLFAPLGLRLFPTEAIDAAVSCTCAEFAGRIAPASSTPGASMSAIAQGAASGVSAPAVVAPSASTGPASPWCKHACCVMFLIGERLAREPLQIFGVRGLSEQDLLERLRQHRAIAGMVRASAGPAPVYVPYLPGLADAENTPLEACVEDFWVARPVGSDASAGEKGVERALADVDLSATRPEVLHPLLRRLGPSPLSAPATPPLEPVRETRRRRTEPPPVPVASKPIARFPLVGLLATCYDVIGEAALTMDDQVVDATGDADQTDSENKQPGD